MIRLIVTDVDGTLVPEGAHTLYEEYFPVIRKLTQRGIVFAVATGRHIDSTRNLFKPVEDLIYFITDNGAAISTSREMIMETTIPRELYLEILKDSEKLEDCQIISTTNESTWVSPKASKEFYHLLKDEYQFTVSCIDDLKNLTDVSKFSVFHSTDIQGKGGWLVEQWKDRLYGVQAGASWIDFMPLGTSKKTALEYLMESLSIKPEEVMAFGDQLNDVEMIRMAGRGYAVETARDICKEVACGIVPSWDKYGVLQMLESFIKEESLDEE